MDKIILVSKQLLQIQKLIIRKDEKKIYDKKYNFRNKEKIKEYNRDYYARNKEKLCAYNREYHKNKPKRIETPIYDNSKSELSEKDLVINFT